MVLYIYIYIYIPINPAMELYKDLGRFFIHESPRRFYGKRGCNQKGHLSLLEPRKREPTRIPMASSAWVFRPKNACPRALPKDEASDGNAPLNPSTLVEVLEPSVRGEVSSPLPPSAGPLFCTSSRGSFEILEPNRFSGLAHPKPRTPRVSLSGVYLGYFC